MLVNVELQGMMGVQWLDDESSPQAEQLHHRTISLRSSVMLSDVHGAFSLPAELYSTASFPTCKEIPAALVSAPASSCGCDSA